MFRFLIRPKMGLQELQLDYIITGPRAPFFPFTVRQTPQFGVERV
jgi:hypothetical protein